MAISNGMKLFITGITFALLAAAAGLDKPFLFVGGILAALGCILIWLGQ